MTTKYLCICFLKHERRFPFLLKKHNTWLFHDDNVSMVKYFKKLIALNRWMDVYVRNEKINEWCYLNQPLVGHSDLYLINGSKMIKLLNNVYWRLLYINGFLEMLSITCN